MRHVTDVSLLSYFELTL